MNQSYWVIEARINDAINYITENSNASIAKIARDFDVLLGRLQRRCVEYYSKSSRLAIDKVLLNEMKATLCEYIH